MEPVLYQQYLMQKTMKPASSSLSKSSLPNARAEELGKEVSRLRACLESKDNELR